MAGKVSFQFNNEGELEKKIRKIIFIEQRYLASNFGLETLSMETGLSLEQLRKWFELKLNENFTQLIRRLRVEYLETLVKVYGDGLELKDYARFSGFSDTLSMSKAYLKVKGKSFTLVETQIFVSKVLPEVVNINDSLIKPEVKMKEYNELKELIADLESDFVKFYDGGNKSAGTRVRKGLLEIRNLCQDIRKDVQEKKNS